MLSLPRCTLLALACSCSTLSALPQIALDTVFVGNPGNTADSSGLGGVNYGYYIGTYEVTNSQYASFLNATAAFGDPYGLYNPFMGSSGTGGIERTGSGTAGSPYTYAVKAGMSERPVNNVSFWNAARFVNWVGTGNTETGVYMLGGAANPANSITRNNAAWLAGGIAIASENEWFKAAYYDPTLNGGLGGYWLYPTQGPVTPSNQLLDPDPGNNANFYYNLQYTLGAPNFLTPVGSFENSASYYGTYDQAGNVSEWTDTINTTFFRSIRGGSYSTLESTLRNTADDYGSPGFEDNSIGFRIVSLMPVVIPEPRVYALGFGVVALGWVLLRRRGRAVT